MDRIDNALKSEYGESSEPPRKVYMGFTPRDAQPLWVDVTSAGYIGPGGVEPLSCYYYPAWVVLGEQWQIVVDTDTEVSFGPIRFSLHQRPSRHQLTSSRTARRERY